MCFDFDVWKFYFLWLSGNVLIYNLSRAPRCPFEKKQQPQKNNCIFAFEEKKIVNREFTPSSHFREEYFMYWFCFSTLPHCPPPSPPIPHPMTITVEREKCVGGGGEIKFDLETLILEESNIRSVRICLTASPFCYTITVWARIETRLMPLPTYLHICRSIRIGALPSWTFKAHFI